jgi:hypothetical protein
MSPSHQAHTRQLLASAKSLGRRLNTASPFTAQGTTPHFSSSSAMRLALSMLALGDFILANAWGSTSYGFKTA